MEHVDAAHREIAPALEEASTFFEQKEKLETRAQLLDAFNKHFTLAEESLMLLTTSVQDPSDEFFTVLHRLKQVYVDCQILLGSENQRLGLELMEQSSKFLNAGYQKLSRWMQREFKSLNLESPQISVMVRRALRELSERPSLFKSCLDVFSEAREQALTDSFYAALTGSSNKSDGDAMTKPIEFYAHDVLRYVSDMLAWTHSATVSEYEAFETLFVSEGDGMRKGFEAGKEAEPWSAKHEETFDGRKALGELVNRDVAGIARAMRQRIEQVLHNHEDVVLLYKIANLIGFYKMTFSKLLGPESILVETLSTLEESSIGQFQANLSDAVAAVRPESFPVAADLGIPDFLEEALSNFRALMKIYDSSLTSPSSRQANFETIIAKALNPFLIACEASSKRLTEPADSVFLLNCLLATRESLVRHDFVRLRLSDLDSQTTSINAVLEEYQHAFFLHTSGLHPLLSAIALSDESQDSLAKIPSLPPFQPQAVAETSQTLDDFLPSALMDAVENLRHLSSPKIAHEITAEAAERFCEDYEFVESKMDAVDELRVVNANRRVSGHNVDDADTMNIVPLKSLFPRSSSEMRVLLS